MNLNTEEIETLIADLEESDIRLSVLEDQLRYDAPPEKITNELLKLLKTNKQSLINYIKTSDQEANDYKKSINPRRSDETVPLTNDQMRLWFLDSLETGSSFAYNMPPVVLRLIGSLDTIALSEAFTQLVARHEILRTSFRNKDGHPFQYVNEPMPIKLAIEERKSEEEVYKDITKEAKHPFSLSNDQSLFRVRIFQVSKSSYIFCLTIHHIICDGWSIGILVRELSQNYLNIVQANKRSNPKLRIQYGDYAIWYSNYLKNKKFLGTKKFWKKYLKDYPQTLSLPTDFVRQGQSDFRGNTEYSFIPVNLTSEIKKLCLSQNLTEYMFLLAGYFILLHRFTGDKDLVIGTPVSVRPKTETEDLIGLFLNTIPIRSCLDREKSISNIINDVKQSFLEAFENKELPLDEIMNQANIQRAGKQNPLFQTLFALQNAPLGKVDLESLVIEPIRTVNVNSVLDLVMSIEESNDKYEVKMRGASQLLTVESIKLLLSQYHEILQEMVHSFTSQTISQPLKNQYSLMPLLPEKKFPIECSIFSKFSEIAKTYPDRRAVVYESDSITYYELSQKVASLSKIISRFIKEPGDPVAIYVSRSYNLIISILAVLECGGSYVPLDPDSSSERIRFIIEDSKVAAIILDKTKDHLPFSINEIPQIDLSEIKQDRIDHLNQIKSSSDDVAYMIYTSGSTGIPKGVQVTHKNVLRLIESTQDLFSFKETDVWTLFHSPAFDFSVWEIFGALLSGGCLAIVPWKISRDPAEFYKFTINHKVTVLNQTPSAFKRFIQVDKDNYSKLFLRWVIFGGESLDFSSLKAWVDKHGVHKPKLVNMYGITETTVHTTYRAISIEDFSRPQKSRIGAPLPDLQIIIVDENMRPVMRGAIGEILVCGDGVAKGYFNRPELNSQRFIYPNKYLLEYAKEVKCRIYRSGDMGRIASDNDIEYCGRIDDQIKIHGYRIEPGEIENVIRLFPDVKDSVVKVIDESGDLPYLAAYISWFNDKEAKIKDIRKFVSSKLPKYMCPAKYVFVTEFSLNINGKIDKKSLPLPNQSPVDVINDNESSYFKSENLSQVSRIIMKAWAEAVGVRNVGLNDDFFELGGDSVRAAILINNLQRYFEQILYVAGIFEYPVLGDYCNFIESEYHLGKSSVGSSKVLDDRDFADFSKILVKKSHEFTVNTKKNPPAVFILSPPRSGSTLLRVILAGHPDIFAPPELELIRFENLKTRAEEFSGPLSFYLEGLQRAVMEINGVNASESLQWIDALKDNGCTSQEMFLKIQNLIGQKILVDKTPSYALDLNLIDRIEHMFEEPLYIHLYRHPCGMIRSFLNAHMDQIFFRHDHKFNPRELAELIWTGSHRNVLEGLVCVPSQRKITIQFEELTRDTESEVQKICTFLSKSYNSVMIDPYRYPSGRMTDGIIKESRMIGDVRFNEHKKIESHVSDEWREKLSEVNLSEKTKAVFDRLLSEHDTDTSPSQEKILVKEKPMWQCSLSQERLWFLDKLDKSSKAYTLPGAMLLTGKVDQTSFKSAVSMLAERHQILKCKFKCKDDHVLLDPSSGSGEVIWKVIDDLDQKQEAREIRRLIKENESYHFRLEEEPLFRIQIVTISKQKHLMLVNIHHAVCDGWSLDIVYNDLAELYNSCLVKRKNSLPKIECSFGDFSKWQRSNLNSENYVRQLRYWNDRLSNTDFTPVFLTDYPRQKVQTFKGDRINIHFDLNMSDQIKRESKRLKVTTFMFMLSCFGEIISANTNVKTVCIGTPTSYRPKKEYENLVGFFANTLVLKFDIFRNNFQETLKQVKKCVVDALSNQDVSFEHLVNAIQPERNLGLSPLFQVLFSLRRQERSNLNLEELNIEHLHTDISSSKFDLSILLDEYDDEIGGCIEFNPDLFSRKRISFLIEQYYAIVRKNIDINMTDNDMFERLGETERNHIKIFSSGLVKKDYHEYTINNFVEKGFYNRERDAVRCGNIKLSFGQIENGISSAIHKILKAGVRKGDKIGIYMERSVSLVPWLLGILKVGAVYVPLDLETPEERLKYIELDSNLKFILSSNEISKCSCLYALERINAELDYSSEYINHLSDLNHDPDMVAYICYTSGTTGQPKGVPITHKSVVNLLCGMQDHLKLKPTDIWLALTTITFDIHIPEMFLSISQGGMTHIALDQESKNPKKLVELVSTDITICQATPSLWSGMLLSGWSGSKPLKILSGGEKLSKDLAASLFKKSPEVWNLYGPTETTVWSSMYKIPNENMDRFDRIPIGHPLLNTSFYVIDENYELTPVGSWGQLVISGHGLSKGYLNKNELTNIRFIRIPHLEDEFTYYLTGDSARLTESGLYEIGGRLDNQIKVRGVRIEPEEIETVLESHDDVGRAVVFITSTRKGDSILTACLELKHLNQNIEQNIKDFSRQNLPASMVPGKIITLDRIPLTSNGKVDRKKTIDLAPHSDECIDEVRSIEGRDLTEVRLTKIWRTYLERVNIGIDDNFFDCGGHSLLAVRLLGAVDKEFQCNLPLAAIFEMPTIRLMSEKIRKSNGSDLIPSGPLELRQGDKNTIIFLIPGAGGNIIYMQKLAFSFPDGYRVIGLQPPGLDGKTKPLNSISDLASLFYKQIQSFRRVTDTKIVVIGHSFGGLVAYNLACQAQEKENPIHSLFILDSAAPDLYQPVGRDWADSKWIRHLSQVASHMFDVDVLVDEEELSQLPYSEQIDLLCRRLEESEAVASGSNTNFVSGLVGVYRSNLSASIEHSVLNCKETSVKIIRSKHEQPDHLLDDHTKKNRKHKDLGWSHYLGAKIEVIEAEGDHLSMLQKTNATKITKLISKEL